MSDFEYQRKLAEQRRQRYGAQADFQAPQGQMVSGHFVAPNPLQYLAAGLRSIGGMRGENLANQEIADIGKREKEMVMGETKALAQALRGTPQETAPFQAPTFDEQDAAMMGQQGMQNVTKAAVPGSYDAFLARALESPLPQFQQMGMQQLAALPEREARAAEKQAERDFRVQQLQDQHAMRMEALAAQNASRQQMAEEQRNFQRQMAQMQIDARREISGAISGGQKAPAGYRYKDDGTLEPIPGGPAADKSGQKPLTEGQAKGTLFLGQMRSASSELEKLPEVSPVQTAMTGSTLTNFAAGPNAQKVAQLQNQWAEAYLRAKTGAAATQGEVELNRRTFFPVVGDTAEVRKQKSEMRKQAEIDMQATAGPGAATAGQGRSESVTVGGQTYTKPANMTDAQWNAYKQSVGAR